MSSNPPSSTTITRSTFDQALKLYPSLVEKVYASKLRNDAKKVTEALKRDRWRFEELPSLIAERRGKGKGDGEGLSKDEVERLVLWKITHGHSRPFLPGMVRKNDASAIEMQTSLAFRELASNSNSKSTSFATVSTALDLVCKLTGIGPATGTLILNVFDSEHIPFFQDEMFAWFFPKSGKLKYTAKEYLQLFEAVTPVLKRLSVSARDLEKVTYVLGHLEFLGDGEREALEKPSKASDEALPENEEIPEQEDDEKKATTDQKDPVVSKKAKKRTAEEDDRDKDETQTPKRRSQRKT
ncbi:hypothetical protein H2200_007986 [Cladophialophora chaetospira]|uniref:Uncharacterized protein n=1 Tax=Cladophialophora chaetospira TaxID=386627 RepID=A0AA38X6T6_9EURO|nr:hypothetical protein H2200_007986 [Cladophialophora chaetospira]